MPHHQYNTSPLSQRLVFPQIKNHPERHHPSVPHNWHTSIQHHPVSSGVLPQYLLAHLVLQSMQSWANQCQNEIWQWKEREAWNIRHNCIFRVVLLVPISMSWVVPYHLVVKYKIVDSIIGISIPPLNAEWHTHLYGPCCSHSPETGLVEQSCSGMQYRWKEDVVL